MSTVEIKVNGVDVTDVVRYADAVFTSQVNGVPGECGFAIRDLGHTYGFVQGHTINVKVDGTLRWSGFVMAVKRQYTSDVVDTTVPGTVARWFLITGLDVNLLLTNRVVYNHSTPARGDLPPQSGHVDPKHANQWAAETPADVMIQYVIEHYTDLGDDGVTLDLGITDSPNPDFGGAVSGAVHVADFMRDTNRLLGGIWYLTPDRVLVHKSVETATVDYTITDQPSDPDYTIGPRDFAMVSDAAQMVNDALVWGTAPGVSRVTFKRATDTTARDLHGLWQLGEFDTSIYKDASVQKRADALIYGNDVSQFGAHNDRISCTATIFSPLLKLGDVVHCRMYVFDYPGAPFISGGSGELRIYLPIRRITLTFPTPTDVQYDLLLTQELDEPWSIYEYVFPKFKFPGFGGFDGGGGGLGGGGLPPGEGGCADGCGITDGFHGREVAGGLGVADSSLVWTSYNNASRQKVTGGVAVLTLPGSAGTGASIPTGPTLDFTLESYIDGWTGPYSDIYNGPFVGIEGGSWWVEVDVGLNQQVSLFANSESSDEGVSISGVDLGQPYKVRVLRAGTDVSVWVWNSSDPMPGSPTASATMTDAELVSTDIYLGGFSDSSGLIVVLSGLDAVGVTRCTRAGSDSWMYEPFDRSDNSSFGGNPTTGNAWINDDVGTDTWGMGNSPATAVGANPPEPMVAFVSPDGSHFGPHITSHLAPYSGAPWTFSPFSFRARFRIVGQFGPVSAISPTVQFDLLGDNALVHLVAKMDTAAGFFGFDDAGNGWSTGAVAKTDWAFDTVNWPAGNVSFWYVLEGVYNNGVGGKVRCYQDCTTPPAWSEFTYDDASVMGIDGTCAWSMTLSTIDLTNLEIDAFTFNPVGDPCGYGGAPCGSHFDCGAPAFNDAFARDVSSPDWGAADSGGDGDWSVSISDPDAVGVTASVASSTGGRLHLPVTTSDQPTGALATINLLALTLPITEFVCSFDLTFVSQDLTDSSGNPFWDFGINAGGGSSFLSLDTGAISGAHGQRLQFGAGQTGHGFANAGSFQPVELATGVEYHFLWTQRTGYMEVKFWLTTDPEPDAGYRKAIPYAIAPWDSGVSISTKIVGADDQSAFTVDIRNVELLVGCGIVAIPPESGGGLPLSGFVCESITHSGGTAFAATRAWTMGSLEVYVNGELLLPDQYDQTSYATGEFVLDVGILSADALRVCYRANGVPA